jgi:hypothetical protein
MATSAVLDGTPSHDHVAGAMRLARVAGFAVALVGLVVLMGWFFGIHGLTSLAPGWSSM